jgi:hypothetical protein
LRTDRGGGERLDMIDEVRRQTERLCAMARGVVALGWGVEMVVGHGSTVNDDVLIDQLFDVRRQRSGRSEWASICAQRHTFSRYAFSITAARSGPFQ